MQHDYKASLVAAEVVWRPMLPATRTTGGVLSTRGLPVARLHSVSTWELASSLYGSQAHNARSTRCVEAVQDLLMSCDVRTTAFHPAGSAVARWHAPTLSL